jgi:hypothetical protein
MIMRIAAWLMALLLCTDAAFAGGEAGVWGRVTQFSKGESWASAGVLFKDRYTLGMTATQDGTAVDLGVAYPFSRLGMTSNMVHLSLGLIDQRVDLKDDTIQEFHGYYGTLTVNYALLFLGVRVVERDIDRDLEQKRGRIVRKSISDFFIGVGLVLNPELK